jgi:type IV secretory pathway VirB2 component (pilin)
MTRGPVGAAAVAAVVTLLIGLALSLLARRLGWTARVSWVAAVLVPLAVAAAVYYARAKQRS